LVFNQEGKPCDSKKRNKDRLADRSLVNSEPALTAVSSPTIGIFPSAGPLRTGDWEGIAPAATMESGATFSHIAEGWVHSWRSAER